MIRTYYANVNNISFSELNLSKVTPQRREKIDRILIESAKKQSLAAGLLINHFFSDKEIKTEKQGKPYIENGPYFNIAHSNDYAIISISYNEPIGCDIEEMNEVKYEKMGKLVFHKNEMKILKSSDNQNQTFYDFWTKKEAFIKCLGTGFHLNTKNIDLSKNSHFFEYKNQRFRFKEYMLDNYKIMLCSTGTDFENSITEIKFE
ncbi:MAG: 4'-phosphopantetheinyl transferase family protein [Ruminococcus sp.]